MAENLYLMMNKPCGYVCSALSDSHKTIYDLLTPDLQKLVQGAKRGHRLHTIGRLDCDTSGLLLLTTDGNFSHNLTASKSIGGGEVKKTYRVLLENPLSKEVQADYILKAAAGLTLPPEKKAPEQKASPAQISFLNERSESEASTSNLCYITITEGKFHEVRRLFRALGNEVLELERISIGNLSLPENLKAGTWRKLTEEEKSLLIV